MVSKVLPSRPREFHPEPLTDSVREPLDSYGSCHRAKAAIKPAAARARAPAAFVLAPLVRLSRWGAPWPAEGDSSPVASLSDSDLRRLERGRADHQREAEHQVKYRRADS